VQPNRTRPLWEETIKAPPFRIYEMARSKSQRTTRSEGMKKDGQMDPCIFWKFSRTFR